MIKTGFGNSQHSLNILQPLYWVARGSERAAAGKFGQSSPNTPVRAISPIGASNLPVGFGDVPIMQQRQCVYGHEVPIVGRLRKQYWKDVNSLFQQSFALLDLT